MVAYVHSSEEGESQGMAEEGAGREGGIEGSRAETMGDAREGGGRGFGWLGEPDAS